MQKTAYEMRISDWSSDVCSSDLPVKDEQVKDDGSGRAAGLLVLGAHLGQLVHDQPVRVDLDGAERGPSDHLVGARGGGSLQEHDLPPAAELLGLMEPGPDADQDAHPDPDLGRGGGGHQRTTTSHRAHKRETG